MAFDLDDGQRQADQLGAAAHALSRVVQAAFEPGQARAQRGFPAKDAIAVITVQHQGGIQQRALRRFVATPGAGQLAGQAGGLHDGGQGQGLVACILGHERPVSVWGCAGWCCVGSGCAGVIARSPGNVSSMTPPPRQTSPW